MLFNGDVSRGLSCHFREVPRGCWPPLRQPPGIRRQTRGSRHKLELSLYLHLRGGRPARDRSGGRQDPQEKGGSKARLAAQTPGLPSWDPPDHRAGLLGRGSGLDLLPQAPPGSDHSGLPWSPLTHLLTGPASSSSAHFLFF